MQRLEGKQRQQARYHNTNTLILNIKYYKKDSRYSRVSNLNYFWSGDNLVKFRNIKKHIWISKDDVSHRCKLPGN